MSDIFISHVHEDAPVALRIALGLEELGYSTWCYEIDYIPGESYLTRSSEVIDASLVVVVILSDAMRNSPRQQVQAEVIYAYEHNKRLIPVLNGMSHVELQKSPQLSNIRMALGAAVSVPVTAGGVGRLIPKIAEGIRIAGVQKRAEVAHDRIAHIRDEIGDAPFEAPPPPRPPSQETQPPAPKPPVPPPPAPSADTNWTRVLLGIGGVLLLGGAVLGGIQRWGSPPTPEEQGAQAPTTTLPPAKKAHDIMAVGVMDIRPFGAPDWMCDSTRTNVNTVLSKFEALKVFAEEKIDFLRKKRDLTAIEAAEELKIKKMISGTVQLKDGIVTLDAHVVDIETSVLEHSAKVSGKEDQLIELQNRVTLKLLEEMQIEMDPKVVKAILAERTNDDIENYKLLTETLGGGEDAPAEKHSETPQRRHNWLAMLSPTAAYAADPGEETAVRGALEAYRAALEAEDLDELAKIQLEMSEGQKNALSRYFQNAEELKIQFSNYDILLEGEDAIATFTRSDVFKDAKTGREVRLEVRISSELTKKPDGWKITGLKKPS